ncbi:MAG: hypothetical protein RLZZ396_1825 [Planctomycetota bacterium]|jgi:hypothetical protein
MASKRKPLAKLSFGSITRFERVRTDLQSGKLVILLDK